MTTPTNATKTRTIKTIKAEIELTTPNADVATVRAFYRNARLVIDDASSPLHRYRIRFYTPAMAGFGTLGNLTTIGSGPTVALAWAAAAKDTRYIRGY